MTKPAFPDKVRVDASTSPLFPVGSSVLFRRLEPCSPRARIILEKEGQTPEDLFEKELPDVALPGAGLSVDGPVRGENGQQLQLVITICTGEAPGRIPTKYLVGQIFDPNDRDPGGTGVWVAEAGPPTQGE